MPVNWNDLDIDAAIESAANATDEKLASKISSLTKMTDDQVQELFPVPDDVKKLTELMKIVKSAEGRNTKINNIVANAEEFGGVILTLLDKFV